MTTRRFVTMVAFAAVATLPLASCSSDPSGPAAVDRAFLQMMIPHHERAIEVARIGIRDASDPRVTAFAARIVREQSPELARMSTAARGLELDLATGARTAQHRITDAQIEALTTLRGRAFDQQFLRLNIASETGAAAMARTERDDGHLTALHPLASSIASAPDTQIPELRRLLTALS